ncbi:MAG TPA: 6-pyruvoyl-tetrahydropterin synthase-related protein [Polyangia bacterium]
MVRDSKLLLVMAVAIGLWMPLARLDWFLGHEQASYVLRTVEWAGEMRAGELYPRWCPDFYGGYGSPFFVFHGPVIYGLAGMLSATFLDPFWALKMVVLLGSLLAGVGTYALVFGETRDRDSALLGAVAYLAAPYRLGDLYDRGDLGEFVCIALLPVVIALYRAVVIEALPRRAQRFAVAAAVAHAIMIMTHPVMGLWGTVVIGLIVLCSVVRFAVRGSFHRVLLLMGAMVCAPGLAALYIVPAMAYRGITHTALMITGVYNPLDHWLAFDTLFAKSTPSFPRNFMQIGPLFTVALAAALVGVTMNPRRGWQALAWLILGAVLVFLVLPQGNAFWAPHGVPLAPFIQFPWRLLGPAALMASMGLAIGTATAWERTRDSSKRGMAIVGAAMLLFIVAWPYASAKEMPVDKVPLDAESIRQGMISTAAADEYLPIEAAVPPPEPPRALVANADGAAVQYSNSLGSHHLLTVRAERDGAMVGLALHGFPGWRVKTLAGPAGTEAQLDTDDHGLLRLRLPAPGEYRLRLWLGVSPASAVGATLTLLTMLVLGLMLVHASRPWPWRLPVQVRRGNVP